MMWKNQNRLAALAVILSCCSDNSEFNKLVIFETKDARASVAMKNGLFYTNPLVQNGVIDSTDVGKKILYYRNTKKEMACHNFGNSLIIAKFKSHSEKCFGWRFEKRVVGLFSEYSSFCEDENLCIDSAFKKRPFSRYWINNQSELVRFRFDPSQIYSIDYLPITKEPYVIK